VRLAEAYVQTKKDSLAALTYEQALSLNATNADIYGDLGATYMRMRQWDRAAAVFEKRYKLDPTSTSSFVNYGICNMVMGRFDTARVAFRQAIALRPQYLPSHLNLARSLMQPRYKNDSLQTAKAEFETVIALADPAVVRYKNELVESYRGIAYTYVLDKKYAEAVEALDKGLKLNSDEVQSLLLKAQCLALMNKREEAIQAYRKVLKLDPKNKTAKDDLQKMAPPDSQ
jgi:Tfp pilus assembly protein PilF